MNRHEGSALLESLVAVFITALIYMLTYVGVSVISADMQYTRKMNEEKVVLDSVCEAILRDRNYAEVNGSDVDGKQKEASIRLMIENATSESMGDVITGVTQDKTFTLDEVKKLYGSGTAYQHHGIFQYLNDEIDQNYNVTITLAFSKEQLYKSYDSETSVVNAINPGGASLGMIPVRIAVTNRARDWETGMPNLFIGKTVGSLSYYLQVCSYDYFTDSTGG